MHTLRKLWLRSRRGARALAHPVSTLAHRRRSRVLAGPGHAGFAGGLFNPGVAPAPDGGLIAIAKGQHMHWQESLRRQPDAFMRGAPVSWRLASAEAPLSEPTIVQVHGGEHDAHSEDYRPFQYRGRVLVSHPETRFDEQGDRSDTQVLSELIDGSLHKLGQPRLDFPLRAQERNWLFAECNEGLMLFYSASPYRVLALEDEPSWRFRTLFCQAAPAPMNDPNGSGMMVSFSAHPATYDDDSLLLLIHQKTPRSKGQRYEQWGVLISRTTLRPRCITRTPIFDSPRRPRPGIRCALRLERHSGRPRCGVLRWRG